MLDNQHGPLHGGMWIRLEPGDGTRYEFVIVWDPTAPGYLLIMATGGGAEFHSYGFESGELKRFGDKFPEWLEADTESYRRVAANTIPATDLVSYMVGKAQCNPWTALAAIRAANIYLRKS